LAIAAGLVAVAAMSVSDDARAQIPSKGVDRSAPIVAPTIATLPGQFAFRNNLSNRYVSASAGTLGMAATAGASERFRLAPERGTTNFRFLAPSGAFVTIAATAVQAIPQIRPASLAATGTVFDLKVTREATGPVGGQKYTYWASATVADAPAWSFQHGQTTDGWHPAPSAWNLNSNANAKWTITKCGDVGTGIHYALRPVGSKTASYPMTIVRQADGTHAVQRDGGQYWSAVGGGGNAPGKGSDGLPIAFVDTVGTNEKLKLLDQGNCTYAIQTAKGWHFGMKAGEYDWATLSTRISEPSQAPTIGYVAYFELIPTAL
jgi:hypothetical protein